MCDCCVMRKRKKRESWDGNVVSSYRNFGPAKDLASIVLALVERDDNISVCSLTLDRWLQQSVKGCQRGPMNRPLRTNRTGTLGAIE